MSSIDRYAYFNALSEKNPFLKMGLGILALVLSLVIDNIPFHLGVLAVVSLVIIGIAKIPMKGYFNLYKIPGGFLLLSVFTVLVSVSSSGGAGGVTLGSLRFMITPESQEMALNLFFRALACISATYFIALTVPINQQVFVFKRFRLPTVFIEMVVLIYRFINIFMEEFHTMQNAMELKLGNRNLKTSVRSLSLLGTGIFFRVMDSYTDWKNVLEVKLYDGNFYF